MPLITKEQLDSIPKMSVEEMKMRSQSILNCMKNEDTFRIRKTLRDIQENSGRNK